MAPVHRRVPGTEAWARYHKDTTMDQTSDHGKCQMTRGMTSPGHKELTCPAKSCTAARCNGLALVATVTRWLKATGSLDDLKEMKKRLGSGTRLVYYLVLRSLALKIM